MIVSIYKIHAKVMNIKNRVYNYYFDNLVKTKKLGTKNVLIDKKNHKGFVISYTIYVHSETIKMLSLHYRKDQET